MSSSRCFAILLLRIQSHFLTRALTLTKQNYSVYMLEMFRVIRAVKRFRVYLLGPVFLLENRSQITDKLAETRHSINNKGTK